MNPTVTSTTTRSGPRTGPRLVLGLGLALTATLLAGCGTSQDTTSGGSTPIASATGTSGSAGSAGSSSAPPSSATPSPSSSATPTGPASCTAADLEVGVAGGDGAAGSDYYTVTLTNTGSQPCTTRGYGGVSLVSRPQGPPIGAPADRERRPAPKPVALQPGGVAQATLQVTNAQNYPRATCRPTPAKGFRVYPPDQTRSTFVVSPGLTACRAVKVHLMSLRAYTPVG